MRAGHVASQGRAQDHERRCPTALIAIALTLCAVFVPTAFISGISGLFFKQFAITISASTVISCFVSLTLSPALCAVLLKPHQRRPRRSRRGWPDHCSAHASAASTPASSGLSSSYGKADGRASSGRPASSPSVYVAPDRSDGLPGVRGCPPASSRTQDIGYLVVIVHASAGSEPGTHGRRSSATGQRHRPEYRRARRHTSPVTGFDVTTYTVAPNVGHRSSLRCLRSMASTSRASTPRPWCEIAPRRSSLGDQGRLRPRWSSRRPFRASARRRLQADA